MGRREEKKASKAQGSALWDQNGETQKAKEQLKEKEAKVPKGIDLKPQTLQLKKKTCGRYALRQDLKGLLLKPCKTCRKGSRGQLSRERHCWKVHSYRWFPSSYLTDTHHFAENFRQLVSEEARKGGQPSLK